MYNDFLTIQIAQREKNDTHETIVTYVDSFNIWGEVIALSGREVTASNQVKGVAYYKIKARYDARIKSDMQIKWNDHNVIIKLTAPPIFRDGRKNVMELLGAVTQ